MNVLKTSLIAALAIVATAIVPVSNASAAGLYNKPVNGKHVVHKGGPGYHHKHGPRGAYPRDYHKKRPPVVVQKGKGNALAAGILGFAAGAIVGNALGK